MGRRSLIAMLVLMGSLPVFSQVVPAATKGGYGIVIGAGYSNYYTNLFPNRMYGTALWAEWHPTHSLPWLKGLGIDAEGRMLNFGQKQDASRHVRQYEFGGGPMYTYSRFNNFRPYAKLNIYITGMNHMAIYHFPPDYTRGTWVGGAPGFGMDYRLGHHFWLRADYQYQFWKENFYLHKRWGDPNGYTIGVSYELKRSRP